MTTENSVGAASDTKVNRPTIDWRQVHRNVRRLQMRIVKVTQNCGETASQEGRWKGLSGISRKCAPRNARLNLWRSQKKLGEMLLGHPIYLKMKIGGEKSISEKRESLEDAEGGVLRGPCDMAKAKLPESQSPVVEPYAHRYSV
jgi:hypothetical protein